MGTKESKNGGGHTHSNNPKARETNMKTSAHPKRHTSTHRHSLTRAQCTRPREHTSATRDRHTGNRLASPRYVQLHLHSRESYTLLKRTEGSRLSAPAETGQSQSGRRNHNHHAVTAEHVCAQCPASPSRRSRHASPLVLTLSTAFTSAPLSMRSCTADLRPFLIARCSGVLPPCHARPHPMSACVRLARTQAQARLSCVSQRCPCLSTGAGTSADHTADTDMCMHTHRAP